MGVVNRHIGVAIFQSVVKRQCKEQRWYMSISAIRPKTYFDTIATFRE